MNLHNAEFIISAVSDRQYPKGELSVSTKIRRDRLQVKNCYQRQKDRQCALIKGSTH